MKSLVSADSKHEIQASGNIFQENKHSPVSIDVCEYVRMLSHVVCSNIVGIHRLEWKITPIVP